MKESKTIDYMIRRQKADTLKDDIVTQLKKFGVHIEIIDDMILHQAVAFEVKYKKDTTQDKLSRYLHDVSIRLGLPNMYIVYHDRKPYIIYPDHPVRQDPLGEILHDYEKRLKNMHIPCMPGYDIANDIVIDDLAQFPHLLLGGSSGSGKSVGLQVLIACICAVKSPDKINLVAIDTGATDLAIFNDLPQLACPVITEINHAAAVLTFVKEEMERRIKLKQNDPHTFTILPSLVVVIDEFPALFAETAATTETKELSTCISNMLRRGRHAKIHLVLAAQNPTMQNMRVDLSNVTARIAFRCAKKNFSQTILGEAGAETLTEKGSLFFKSPQHDGICQLQGLYASIEELSDIVGRIKSRYSKTYLQKFTIPDSIFNVEREVNHPLPNVSSPRQKLLDHLLLARIILFTMTQNTVSSNMIMKQFRIGWNKASSLTEILCEMGIVSQPKGKISRQVMLKDMGDITDELLEFMQCNGVSPDEVKKAITAKQEVSDT